MKCEYVKTGEITAIVCSSGRRKKEPKCCKCGRLAMRQCDWKIDSYHTCDAFICSLCTHSPEKGKDLCPRHAEVWVNHPQNPNNEANANQAKDRDQTP